jgi:hypothetical protein
VANTVNYKKNTLKIKDLVNKSAKRKCRSACFLAIHVAQKEDDPRPSASPCRHAPIDAAHALPLFKVVGGREYKDEHVQLLLLLWI